MSLLNQIDLQQKMQITAIAEGVEMAGLRDCYVLDMFFHLM